MSEFGLLIYPRPGFEVDEAMLPPHVRMVHAPCIEVSSTFVRQALRQGKDVRFFLPAKVYDEVNMLFKSK